MKQVLVWMAVGIALSFSRLAAQDVIVTDPAWMDPEASLADVLPTFKKRPKLVYPDEIKKDESVAYVLAWETLDESGARVASQRAFTNPHLEGVTGRAIAVDVVKYTPAKRDGKAVMATFWFSMIFNSRSADEGKKDATVRLQAVAPVIVKQKDLPPDTELPLVIWAKLSIDEKGRLKNYSFEDGVYESLRLQVDNSLRVWKFLPARREGRAVAGELIVPFILNQQYTPKMPGAMPKPLVRVQPIYPFAMKYSGFRGEVLLEFIVDKTGQVKDPIIVKTNNPNFNEAAIEALLKWKFIPGSVGGEPVSCRMQQPFEFEIVDDDGRGEGRDYMAVKKGSKKALDALPADLRYDEPPKAKALAKPVFPYSLREAKKYGKVKIVFLIDPSGKVVEVNVLESSEPEFGLALTAALEAYEFYPATKGGKPIASILNMAQEFSSEMIDEEDRRLLKLEQKHPEKIFTPKKLDAPLHPLYRCGAKFPSGVRESQASGKALVEALVDEEGNVRLPRVVEATNPAFGYAAVQSMASWRFDSPKVGGKPAVVRVRVPFEFLSEADTTRETTAAPSKGS